MQQVHIDCAVLESCDRNRKEKIDFGPINLDSLPSYLWSDLSHVIIRFYHHCLTDEENVAQSN